MKISLIPYAGLCNRMNAIICGIAVNEATGCHLDILWPYTHECKIRFHDLFQSIDTDSISIKPLRNILYKLAGPRNLFLPDLLRKVVKTPFDAVINGSQTVGLSIPELTGNHRHLLIHSFNRFCLHREFNEVGTIFRPNARIARELEKAKKNFGSRTIGLHIRRTDNIVSRNQSPTSLFIGAIGKEIATSPATKVFIASDSLETTMEIYRRFPDNVIKPDAGITLNRNSGEGMIQAAIDLYTLAATDKIYGSSGSTFSLMASNLYGAPLEILSRDSSN